MSAFAWLATGHVDVGTIPIHTVLFVLCGVGIVCMCCVRCNVSMQRNAWRMRNAYEREPEEGRYLLNSAGRVSVVVNQTRRECMHDI